MSTRPMFSGLLLVAVLFFTAANTASWGAPVPVDLKSSITGTLISGSAYGVVALASASLVVVNPSGALVSGSYLPDPPQPTTVDTVIDLFPNTVYGVSLNALAYALCGSLDEYGTATCDGNLASASAAVDPTFMIDPGFADASHTKSSSVLTLLPPSRSPGRGR